MKNKQNCSFSIHAGDLVLWNIKICGNHQKFHVVLGNVNYKSKKKIVIIVNETMKIVFSFLVNLLYVIFEYVIVYFLLVRLHFDWKFVNWKCFHVFVCIWKKKFNLAGTNFKYFPFSFHFSFFCFAFRWRSEIKKFIFHFIEPKMHRHFLKMKNWEKEKISVLS